MLLLLLACAADAPVNPYAAALTSADFDAAWALCAKAGADRGDCEQAVAAKHARFDRCEQIEGVWRDECRFAEAEHKARAGDRVGALRACQGSRFAANCEQHVLDGLAMALREAAPAEVSAAYAALAPEIRAKNSGLDFWRSWHRVRAEAGLPLVAEDCPEKACTYAARAEVRKRTEEQIRRAGCGALLPEVPGWTPKAEAWATHAWAERCCRAGSGGAEAHAERCAAAVKPSTGRAGVEVARETE